jgi:hypothetical protein
VTNLHARLEKAALAAAGLGPGGLLPPLFWEALAGDIPPDQLPPETRAAVARVLARGRVGQGQLLRRTET